MSVSTKTRKARSAEAATAIPNSTQLRIESRLKVSGKLDSVQFAPDRWGFGVVLYDAKLSRSLDVECDPQEVRPTETEAIKAAGQQVSRWLEKLAEGSPADEKRLAEVAGQIADQFESFVGKVPETQEEAASKEATVNALSPHRIFPLVNGKLAWCCAGCGETNGIARTDCGKCSTPVLLPDPLPEAPAKKSKGKSRPAAAESTQARHVETRDVPLSKLLPHPLNPRSGEVDIADLVQSLKSQGQLVEAIGREHPTQPGRIELLAGHRRRAAAEQAGWESLRVRIIEATEQQAIEILGRDNEDRKNFTALERARWYQSMLDTLGCSQRDLAKRLGEGHSQGSIANHLVLIKLPDELQELVTTHVISATHARCLATWLDRPAVIAQVQKDLQADVKNREGNGWEPISVPKFEALVNESVRRVSRPTAQGQYHDNCPFRVTDKNRDALDILEVPRSWGGTEKRAFNLTLYSQLSKEAKAKAKQKQKAASPSAPAENEKPAAATYDEHAVAQAKEKWLCLQLAEAVAKLPKKDRLTPLKLFVTLSGTEAMYDVISNRTLMSTVLGIELEESPNRFLKTDQLWQYLEKHEAADLDRVIRNILTQLFGKHPDSGCTDLFDDVSTLLQLCSMLGIDYATDWRPDAEVLEIYPLSLLKDLPASKRIECDDIANFKELSASKEMLIPALLAEWMPGEFPPGLEPV
ncbi:ParB/RepB/Spo0J family partition protein [Planctomicrobium sp. SH661]|uniref:ParB/RepB/Spo0J family partition protein n=1 Tax=Planctomicrobium sp. SH661 TaxID=3448124 RepID=UPI003F5BB1EF